MGGSWAWWRIAEIGSRGDEYRIAKGSLAQKHGRRGRWISCVFGRLREERRAKGLDVGRTSRDGLECGKERLMKLGEISAGCSLACLNLWTLLWARTRQPMRQVHRSQFYFSGLGRGTQCCGTGSGHSSRPLDETQCGVRATSALRLILSTHRCILSLCICICSNTRRFL